MEQAVVKTGYAQIVGKGKANAYSFIGSTEDEDRDGDVVRVAGWDTANFEKNPVVFYGHDYRGNSVKFPVGTAKVSKDLANRRLVFDIQFTESHDDAKTVKALVDEGILRTTSVGFIPKQYNVIVDPESQMVKGREYVSQELLEISVVPLPSNPNAVRLALSKGLVSKQQVEKFGLSEKSEVEELREQLAQAEAAIKALSEEFRKEVQRLDAKMVGSVDEPGDVSPKATEQDAAYFDRLLDLGRKAVGALGTATQSTDAIKLASEAAALLGGSDKQKE